MISKLTRQLDSLLQSIPSNLTCAYLSMYLYDRLLQYENRGMLIFPVLFQFYFRSKRRLTLKISSNETW